MGFLQAIPSLVNMFKDYRMTKDKQNFIKDQNNQLQHNRDFMGSQSNELTERFRNQGNRAQGNADDLYGQSLGGYQGLLNGSYGTSLGAGGSGRTGSIEGSISDLRNFGRNPISQEGINRIRGNGGFDEFAKTGGQTEEYRQDTRRRSDSVGRSIFGAVNNDLQRRAAITGNGGSLSGATARNLRQQAYAAQDNAANTDIKLKDAENEGRRYGISGMSNAELGLQDMQTRAKMGGLQAALSGQMGLMSAEDQRALNAANIDLSGQGMSLQAKIAALGGMQNLRGQELGQVNAGNQGMQNQFNDYWGQYNNLGQIKDPNQPVYDTYGKKNTSGTDDALARYMQQYQGMRR